MNITKQQWTIIGVVVAVIAVWYFFLRKKKAESGYSNADLGGMFESGYSAQTQPRWHCDWTDPRTGVVTTYEGPCKTAKANMGWVTKFD